MLSWASLTIVAIAILAACGGGGGTPAPSPTPSICATPSGLQAALVYPVPNATAVPRAFGQVIVGSTAAFPATWDVVLVTALSPGGVFGGKFVVAPTPLPTPNATPSFSKPVYQSSSFAGGVFPGEVVQVFLNNTSTSCVPTGPLAQFTTQ